MNKGLRGALFAPVLTALFLLGAPSATLAAQPQPQPGGPPAAGSEHQGGAHSGHPDNPDPKDGHAAKPGDPGVRTVIDQQGAEVRRAPVDRGAD